MEIKEAIEYILDGQAVLFTGAGFSLGAINKNGEKYGTANTLKKRLGTALNIMKTESYELQVISNHFIKQKGPESLIAFLKKEFGVNKSEDYHEYIAMLNWKRIYSANYDNIIEKIYEKNGKEYESVTPLNNAEECASKKNLIVHLNGYIEQMTPETLKNYVKLTNASYANDTLKDSNWNNLFSLDLNNAKAIFFIGFSLNYDLDISRLISTNEEIRKKTFFINGKMEDEILKGDLENFGNVTDLDTISFKRFIEEEAKSYIPREPNYKSLMSFKKIKNTSNVVHLKDRDLMDLFFRGDVNEKIMQDFCDKKDTYSVLREKEKDVFEAVNNKEIDLIIVHSSFGNGKTIFIENIKYKLSKMGKTVLIFNENKHFIASDIEKINSFKDSEIVIIIEDYYTIKNELNLFISLNKSKVTLIVTGRSSIHFNTREDLFRNTGFNKERTITLSLDEVNSLEVEQLFKIIDRNGLWGNKSHYNTKSKKSLLTKNARNGFSNLMLEILKSNGMIKRLGEIFNSINYRDNRDILIAVLIVNVIRSDIQLRDILLLLDKVYLTDKEIDESGFKEFIDVDKNKIKIKSGIASKELLSSHVKSDEILMILKKLFLRADKLNLNNNYDYLCRELVSFSNFKILFNGKEDNIVSSYSLEYYESIKNTTFAKRNHFFWLQYAIQKLEQKDYDAAGIYFKNSYSLAKSRNGAFTPYQIDTHYARYQLEKSIYTETLLEDAVANFKEAHELLCKNNEGLTKHYSIRQAKFYKLFIDKYHSEITEAQRMYILSCCKEMLDIIDEYEILCESNKKVEWYVFEAKDALKKALYGNLTVF